MTNEYNCYINLATAVIKRAIDDLQYLEKYTKDHHFWGEDRNYNKIGLDAYEFLSGEELDIWCEIMNISADYVRRQIAKTYSFFKKDIFKKDKIIISKRGNNGRKKMALKSIQN